jgi:uncharacterized protein
MVAAARKKAPKVITESATWRLVDELRVAVVADTHAQPHPRVAELVAARRPHHILHAGDIGSQAVVDDLAKIAPTLTVRGNIDVGHLDFPDEILIDVVRDADESLFFKILLLHIGVNGPRLRAEVARRARAVEAALVICGHSHVPFIGRDAGIGIFNPGSIGPRRFHLPIVFGMMTIEPKGVTLQHVSCETGERWLP